MAGAYGSAYDAEWDSDAIALLDRGFIYAIAAVRGGGELGQFWYEGGRVMAKNNTFADTVAAARHLTAARPRALHALPACAPRHARMQPGQARLAGSVQPTSISSCRSPTAAPAALTERRPGSGRPNMHRHACAAT